MLKTKDSRVPSLTRGTLEQSARLTQSWPRSVGGVGGPGAPYLYPFQGNHQGEAYSADDGPSTPLFRFGEGLGYSPFELSGLDVSPKAAVSAAGSWTLALNVSNTGTRDGATPVQVFFRDPCAFPVRLGSIQLARFTKVWVRAGETKRVELRLAAQDFAYWDDGQNGTPHVGAQGAWIVDPGEFDLVLSTEGFGGWETPTGLLGHVRVAPSAQ